MPVYVFRAGATDVCKIGWALATRRGAPRAEAGA
jgi:hypothetical protein